MAWLHHQWRAIPEWKLTSANLSGLSLLIIPNSEVFDPADLPVLQSWVSQGGKLIVTGNSGARNGESGNFQSLTTYSLAALTGVTSVSDTRKQVLTQYGAGAVLYIRDDIGTRSGQLPSFANALAAIGFNGSVTAPLVPYTVGITLYDDASNLRRFVDLNNTDIDLASDTIHAAPAVHAEVALPSWLVTKSVAARVLTPDGAGVKAAVQQTKDGIVTIDVTGMLRYASVVLEPSATAPQVTKVVNNATFADGPIAPGSIASLFGTGFATGLLQSASASLPLSLAGVSVTIGKIAAPLYFIAPGQIGIQVPYETPLGTQTVTVSVNGKPSNSVTATVAAVAPYLLLTTEGRAVCQNPDFSTNGAGNGAPAGSYVVCYLIGTGVPTAAVSTGVATPSDQLYWTVGSKAATIGGLPANVLFAGLTPNYVGLAQANLAIPAQLPPGDYSLAIELAGAKSNVATVTVR